MYDEKDLQKLIADVTNEFTAHLAKAEQSFNLAKAEDESESKDKAKASKESDGESDKKMESEKPEDKGVKDQHQQDMSKEPAKEASPQESKEGRAEEDKKENAKPSDDPHGDAEDHGYDDEDMQHMHSMYSSMSRGELKAHHDAVRKCMDGMMNKSEMGDAAKDAEGYRPNGGAKDGEAASGKTPASSDMQAFTKSEKDSDSEISLLKSELEAAKAKSEEHKKNLDAVSAFLTKFVEKTVPAGKAITSLDIIAKNSNAEGAEKPLQKSEIDAKLLAKAKDINLSKSDRDAINSYYFSKNVETVRHLLK